MKHIFVVNPVAGNGKGSTKLINEIKVTADRLAIEYEIYITKCVNSAFLYTYKKCRENPNARFYACGGDGTLNEVVNGVCGTKGVEVAVIPCGTGNDFIKNFKNIENFYNIEKQISGSAICVDLICMGDKYAINLCNVGLDSNVAAKVERYKRVPFCSGDIAYGIALASVFMQPMGDKLRIIMDDGEIIDDEFLLAVVGNGICYGGGYYATPSAKIDDGLLDVCLVKKTPRLKIIELIKYYKRGEHLNNEKFTNVVRYIKCKKVMIEPVNNMLLTVDGEVDRVERISFEIAPLAIMFSLPSGCENITNRVGHKVVHI